MRKNTFIDQLKLHVVLCLHVNCVTRTDALLGGLCLPNWRWTTDPKFRQNDQACWTEWASATAYESNLKMLRENVISNLCYWSGSLDQNMLMKSSRQSWIFGVVSSPLEALNSRRRPVFANQKLCRKKSTLSFTAIQKVLLVNW